MMRLLWLFWRLEDGLPLPLLLRLPRRLCLATSRSFCVARVRGEADSSVRSLGGSRLEPLLLGVRHCDSEREISVKYKVVVLFFCCETRHEPLNQRTYEIDDFVLALVVGTMAL
jgi:hypothetical protein